MNRLQIFLMTCVAAIAVAAGIAIWRIEPSGTEIHHDDHQEAASEEWTRGPHRGRLLGEKPFQIELTIFETGIPPVFRAYAFSQGEPLDVSAIDLRVTVHRIGGVVDSVHFKKEADYLLGDQTVVEPHSFTVRVHATWRGESHVWEYNQVEGRVTLPEETLRSSGVTIETAGPAVLRSKLSLNGKVMPNEDQMAKIRARYSGVVKEYRKRLGDKVAKGELLAVIESNESLQPYEVRSQISGTVIERNASLGESISDNGAIYTVADLATVWVDMNVYRRDFARLRIGQEIEIDAEDGGETERTRIAYISPFGTENTQTMLARAVLDNSKSLWRPGLFVKADVTLEKRTVPVAVKSEALQTFRDWDVVFMQDGNLFEVVPLELGQREGEWVEVLSGIKASTRYAVGNSFLLKAELGKSGATHDH
jgi:membrane fusion protein, heavy metal efflux system